MYYYAVVNLKDIVQFIDSSIDPITASDYIEISSEDQTLVGKFYDRYGLYGEVGAFIEPPISILAEHSTNDINYRNQDVWLNDKLDSYATTTQLSNYALSTHSHSLDDLGAASVNHSHSSATPDVDGFMSYADKTKLNSIETNANNYSHPASHPASMITGLSDVATSGSYNDLSDKPEIPVVPSFLPANGGNADTVDNHHASDFATSTHNHDEDYADINHTHASATLTSAGFMSTTDKSKLNGIEEGANNYTHPASHSASMIEETDSRKFMTAAERTKLNGIAENANCYVHPSTHSAAMIEETSVKKIMTSDERTKLAGIATGANLYTHPDSHPASMITGLSDVATSGSYDDLADKPTSMTPTAHTHAQSEITGLETALSGKASASHTHTLDNVTETTNKKIMTSAERTKLSGIATGANLYTHPSSHPASMITGLSDVATSGSYDDLADKPSSMTPTAHTHAQSEITGLETAISGKANVSHTHTLDSVTETTNKKIMTSAERTKLAGIATGANLYTHPASHPVSMITGLSDVATSGSYDDLTDKPTSMTPTAHTHTLDSITETTNKKVMTSAERTKLAGIATGANLYTHPASHPASMITGLSDVATSGSYNDLDDKPTSMTPTAHTHAQSEITGLETALSGKASSSHTHTISQVSGTVPITKGGTGATTAASALTNLGITATATELNYVDGVTSNIQTQLNGKSSTSHSHSAATSSANGFMSSSDKAAIDLAKNRGQIGVCKNITTTGENLDNYIYSGTYTFGGNYTPTNIPAGVNGWLVVFRWNSSDTNATVKQLWFRHGTIGSNDFEIYVRTRIGSEGKWGSWSKVYTSSNPPSATEVGAIPMNLSNTLSDGSCKYSYRVSDNKNVLNEIKNLPIGLFTVYSQSGVTGNPKTTEAWRFIAHKTNSAILWVKAFGSMGSEYSNYCSDGVWQGWRCIFDAAPAPLWTGALYMSSPNSTPQTATPSKALSECRNGWLLLWSDYDPGSGANDSDFATTMIPKRNPTGGTWGGKAFYCDIPRYIGSNVEDVDTERRIIKSIYIHDNCIKGSFNNDKDERNDVVLRAVYEY